MATAAPPGISTTWQHVLSFRLERQGLIGRADRTDLVEVVGRMLGLHAQVMSSAELQAAARIDGLRPSDVRDALWERRSLVKVWAFRQTLHLLTADDLAEFVDAARSLERWHTPAWLRYFDMTEEGIGEVIDAIGDVLSDRPMTRIEVVDAVVKKSRRPQLRQSMLTGWGTFLAPAAQRGGLVFGPSEGRNVAFVQPSAWLGRAVEPDFRPGAADEALAKLIARYLAVFPGASKEMIGRWWGGGRMAAINRALKLAADDLVEIDVDGMRGFVRREDVEALGRATPSHALRLLPGFDPFTNELPRKVESVLGEAVHARVHRTAGWVTPIVVVDGRLAGTWELQSRRAGTDQILVQAFGRLPRHARPELRREAERMAAFRDRPISIEMQAS